MKKILLLLMLSAAVFSCKNSEEKKEDNQAGNVENTPGKSQGNKETTYRGEFIYTADAAVLKGKDFLYGVTLNDEAKELAKRVAEVTKDDYDMVPVIVQGDLKNKPEGDKGWDQILTIKNILYVGKKGIKPDIKLEEPKKAIQ